MRVASEVKQPAATWPDAPMVRMLAAAFLMDALTVFLVFAWGNSYLITTLNAPSALPGYALAVYGFVKLATAPIGGWLLERLGAEALLGAGAAFEVAGIVTGFTFQTATGFLVCVALLATGVALLWLVLFFAVGARSASGERGTAGALLGLSSGAASAAGLAVAPLFTLGGGERAAFLFAAALVAGQVLLLGPACANTGVVTAHRASPNEATPARPGQSRGALALLLFGHFALVSGSVAVLIPYLLRTLGLSLGATVVLMAPAAGAAVLAMYVSGRRSVSGNRFRIAPAFYGAAGIALLALAATEAVPLAVIAMVPIAAGLAAAAPLVNASVLDVTEHHTNAGRTLGWFFFAEGAGAVGGPALAAAAISLWGVHAGMAGAGVGLALLATLITLQTRKSRP